MGDDRGSGFLKGLIIGGILGAIISYFLLRKSGKGSLMNKIDNLASQARETIREAVDEGKQAAARKESQLRGDLEKQED